MLLMTEYARKFQNNALWDTLYHSLNDSMGVSYASIMTKERAATECLIYTKFTVVYLV